MSALKPEPEPKAEPKPESEREQGPKAEPKPESEPEQEPKRRVIVLDTAALIAGTDSLYALGGLIDAETGDHLVAPDANEQVIFYTTPDVVREVRDPRARARLSLLQGALVIRPPSAAAVAAVCEFARATGDYTVLSLADLRVMALSWMLEMERDGGTSLKSKPDVVTAKSMQIRVGKYIPLDEFERRDHIKQKIIREKAEADDGWVTVAKPRPLPPRPRTHKRRGKAKQSDDRSSAVALQPAPTDQLSPYPSTSASDTAQHSVSGHADATAVTSKTQPLSAQLQHSTDGEQHVPSGRASNDKKEEKHTVLSQMGELSLSENGLAAIDDAEGADGKASNDMSAQGDGSNTPVPVSEESHVSVEDAAVQPLAFETVHPKIVYDNDNDSDDGIGWINPENLEQHLARDASAEAPLAEEEERVGCVTTDFAMQNTMLQMGMKILTVDGRRSIRKIKHFALRCHSCAVVTRDLDRIFCDKCGNAAMHRVAFRVNKKGVAHAFLNPKKGPYLRGTKYSIPTPQGGRQNNDLILREDQIDPVKQRRTETRLEKLNVDVFDPSTFYNAGARFNPNDKPVVVGYGRRNPNVVRASLRRKR